MKYLPIILLILLSSNSIYAQTGINTKDPKANLEVKSLPADATMPDGVIFPRVTKDDLITKTTVYGVNQTAALVYITDASAVSILPKFINIDAVGYYHFDGEVWQKSNFSSLKWDLYGNEVSDADYIGTNNAAPLQFKYNNIHAGLLDDLNTSYGYMALNATSTGVDNVAFGLNSLQANTVGNNNTAIGNEALKSNTTGQNNTGVGNKTLTANVVGNDNVAIGNNALTMNLESDNTAVGYNALAANTTGTLNTAIGAEALTSNVIGSSNTAAGEQALKANLGDGNTAIGYQSLLANTEGDNNTAVGTYSLLANTIGSNNVAVGNSALSGNVTGSDNIAIGNLALQGASVSNNIAFGGSALQNLNDTGSGAEFNTALGSNAGLRLITGNNNMFLGGRADVFLVTSNLNYATAIGAGAVVGVSNAIVLGRSDNNTDKVGIGTATPTNAMHVKSATSPLKLEGVQDGGGFALSIGADGVIYKSILFSSSLAGAAAAVNAQVARVNQLTADIQALEDKVNSLK